MAWLAVQCSTTLLLCIHTRTYSASNYKPVNVITLANKMWRGLLFNAVRHFSCTWQLISRPLFTLLTCYARIKTYLCIHTRTYSASTDVMDTHSLCIFHAQSLLDCTNANLSSQHMHHYTRMHISSYVHAPHTHHNMRCIQLQPQKQLTPCRIIPKCCLYNISTHPLKQNFPQGSPQPHP